MTIIRLFYNVYIHKLSGIPGPKSWAATPIHYALSLRSGRHAQKLKDLHLRYGPVVRVAPDEVSLTCTSAWNIIYSGAGSFPKSPRWYCPRPNGEYGIMASRNSDHPRFRRVFAPAFTDKALAGQDEMVTRHIDLLMQALDHASRNGTAVNMTHEIEYTTFSVAGEFAFSEQFNYPDRSKIQLQINFIQSAMKEFALKAVRRTLGVAALHDTIRSAATSIKPEWMVYQQVLASWARARLAGGCSPEREDLMEYISRSTDKRKTLSPGEAQNALGDFMIAGTEAAASGIVSTLYHLMEAPDVLANLQAEICGAFTVGEALDNRRLAELPLLNASVNEGMRLAPSIPAVLPRQVPMPGVEIGGHFMPGGVGPSASRARYLY